VILNGEDITVLPAWKRDISVVLQDLALFPHLDAGGNIAYGPFIRGMSKKERLSVVEETLEIVHLRGYASRRIDTLSGGERQRIAIARALASRPSALLMDEPFSSLDAPLRKSLRREFLEIRNTHQGFSGSGAPCVFVTHDQDEALTLGHRIALISNGRIIETGTGRELLLAPKTETAARFFGAGQVLHCAILEKREEGALVSCPLGNLYVPLHAEVPEPRLFIPEDAISFTDSGLPGMKPFQVRYSGSLCEGKNHILKLLCVPEPVPLELGAGIRMKLPAPYSLITLWVDQSLIRFVNPG
jgi:ABC-type Fe3+/spermidine/putrescine transport system ATPase subunit